MEWWTTIIELVRRKRVIVPVVLVAVLLGATAYLLTPVRYVSNATMVLTTTEFGGTESQDPASPAQLTNPMLNFNDSLKTTSAILIEAMNTKSVAADLGARGRTRLVVDDGRTNPNLLGLNGPFLYVVGRSTSSSEAERIVLEAQRLMRDKLRDWQSALNAPEKTYVSLVDVVPPTSPTVDRARAMRLGLIAFVFGFALSMGIANLRYRLPARRWGAPIGASAVRLWSLLVAGARAERLPDWQSTGATTPDPDHAGEDAEPTASVSLTIGSGKP